MGILSFTAIQKFHEFNCIKNFCSTAFLWNASGCENNYVSCEELFEQSILVNWLMQVSKVFQISSLLKDVHSAREFTPERCSRSKEVHSRSDFLFLPNSTIERSWSKFLKSNFKFRGLFHFLFLFTVFHRKKKFFRCSWNKKKKTHSFAPSWFLC